jgi:hypothetical protein
MVKYLMLLFSFLFMLIMNGLANGLPLNGKTTGELSELYPNLFVPAGLTFSIWGLIYLLLFIFILKKTFETYKKQEMKISNWILLNFIFNGLWIFCWHYEWVLVSLIIMVGLLISLIVHNLSMKEKNIWDLEKVAFGIYLGWICVAIVANFTAFLVSIAWNAWGISQEIWTAVLIIVAGFITAFAAIRLKNPMLLISVLWAFYGIYLKRRLDENQYPLIVSVLIFSSILLVLSVFGSYSAKFFKSK